jgi:formyltetrahydrofolate deformylase
MTLELDCGTLPRAFRLEAPVGSRPAEFSVSRAAPRLAMTAATAILQMICPDQPGLVRELSGWVAGNGGNIVHADHHSDQGAGLFLSRIEWQLEGFGLPREAIAPAAAALAERLNGEQTVTFSDEKPAVAIFVSKQDHCLLDLLWRVRTGELPMRVPLVIANHPELGSIAEEFGARFEHVPISNANREEAEARHLELLAEHGIELVILAKYMQVLTPRFLAAFDPPDAFHRVINIHHSFLPAFMGAQPYHRAWERGVKLIGATGHYVTDELDAGPIIAQSTVNVSHRDEVEDLIRKGRDTERLALARAVRLHLKRQVMVYRGRTAVFE